MRASTAPLIRAFLCRCGAQHPAKAMLQGMPILVCPTQDDDLTRVLWMGGRAIMVIGVRAVKE